MNLGRVIGNIWATQKYPGIEDLPMLLVQPVTGDLEAVGQPIVAVDTVGAGRPGEVVFYITSYEAVIAADRTLVPLDAAICGIVDLVQYHADRDRGIEPRTHDIDAILSGGAVAGRQS